MRILTLNHEYPPLGGGGGKACQDVAKELSSRGHELVILTSHFGDLPKTESFPNLKVVRIPVARRNEFQAGLFTMGLYILEATICGLRLIRSWKPALIHVHFAVPAGVTAFLLHRLTGTPYLLTTHLGDIPGGSPQKTDKWFRWIFPFTRPVWRNATKITTVSAFTASLAKDQYGVTPEVIPNGIPVRKLLPINLQDPPVIFFAGRFVPQKNLGVFLDVLESIRDLHWKCIMLGDGPLRQKITARIAESGLDNRFHIAGWVTPEQVKNEMDQSDILFMPSLIEGLPVVGVQALEAGLAIVASSVGGFTDLVEQNRNGALHSPTDLAGMKQSLTKLLSDKSALLAARIASREIITKFDIRRITSKYESLMIEVIQGTHQIKNEDQRK
jgi:glycosyltransferase involved in cell wall biosynthesis